MNSFVVLLCVIAPLVVRGNKYDTYGGNQGIDCTQLDDGNYPDPNGTPAHCNQFYWTCTDHTATKMDCQAGLWFDPDLNWCESKENIVVCGGEIATTLPPHDSVTLPPSTFDCSENEDGYFPNPKDSCSQIYYSCSGGIALELQCQTGLIFDPETMVCDKPESTYTCTGTRAMTVVTEAPATYAPPQTYAMDCSGKIDGSHVHPTEPCSHTFFVCSHGHVSMITCAGQTYYDEKNERCDTWRNVFACSGLEPLPSVSADLPVTIPATYQHEDFDCTNMPDGSHADPIKQCSSRYFDCSNGHTYERTCPPTLVFNPEENICDGYDNVFVCTGERKIVTTTVLPPTLPPRVPEFPCKGDGFYADPQNDCSGIYWVCSKGIDSKMSCTEGLKFNIETGMCDYFDNVFTCSGQRPQPTYPAPVTESKDLPQLPIDCKTLPDGDYRDPTMDCSQTYYSCSGHIGTERQCGDGLFFDPDLLQCENHDDIPACSGQPRTYPAPTPAPSHDIEEYPFDCSKLEDSNYAAGACEGYYWSCVGGKTYVNNCPDLLAYDAEENLCELPRKIPHCGGERPQPTYAPKSPADEPIYPVHCKTMADGSYSDPADACSQTYYVCSNGRTSLLECPGMLKFDVSRDLCDLKVYVPACGGKIPSHDQDSYQPTRATRAPNDERRTRKRTRGTRPPQDQPDSYQPTLATSAPHDPEQDAYQPTRATRPPLDERRTRPTRATIAPQDSSEDSYQPTHATRPPHDEPRTRRPQDSYHPTRETVAPQDPAEDSYQPTRATRPPLDELHTQKRTRGTRPPKFDLASYDNMTPANY